MYCGGENAGPYERRQKKKKPSEAHLTFCSKISEKMKLLLSVAKMIGDTWVSVECCL